MLDCEAFLRDSVRARAAETQFTLPEATSFDGDEGTLGMRSTITCLTHSR